MSLRLALERPPVYECTCNSADKTATDINYIPGDAFVRAYEGLNDLYEQAVARYGAADKRP